MKKTLLATIICASAILTGCETFLNSTPEAEIGSNNYFTSESALKIYLNGFLVDYTPAAKDIAEDGFNDYIVTLRSTNYLYTVNWNSSLESGWDVSDWHPIYNINYFLAHFREVPDLDDEAYNHYEGTARFWRAWKYWDFVKYFGAVPWYDEPIDSEDYDALYKDRDSREYVMDKVLEDLNFAADNIYDDDVWNDCAQVSRSVALALKSRICLFEGTYRKYHTEDPSTGQPWQDTGASERFLRACVDACETLMSLGHYSIVDDGTDAGRQTQYKKLFDQQTTNRTEVIWAREYLQSMGVSQSVNNVYNQISMGQEWSYDQEFVQTYLHLDGSRHYEKIAERQAAGEDVTLTTELFVDEVADRDYRLQQQIYCPGYKDTFTEHTDSLDFSKTITGYQIHKWKAATNYVEGTASYNSLCMFRYAEILLNYAEAKCELGEMTDDVWDQTIRVLRERSGVDGRRRSDIDPYLAEYYGGLTDADLVEVRRERFVELVMEMPSRYDDVMRWHIGDKFNKTWYGMYVPGLNTPLDLTGNGLYDVMFVENSKSYDKDEFSNVKSIINLQTSGHILENGDHGRLIWDYERYFSDQRYVHPIPYTAIELNSNLTQNHYWEGL